MHRPQGSAHRDRLPGKAHLALKDQIPYLRIVDRIVNQVNGLGFPGGFNIPVDLFGYEGNKGSCHLNKLEKCGVEGLIGLLLIQITLGPPEPAARTPGNQESG